MKCALVYKATVFRQIFNHSARRAEAWELMCPLAFSGTSLPERIKPSVSVVNVSFIAFKWTAKAKYKQQNRKACLNHRQVLSSHLSKYKNTNTHHNQTHPFTQCEFTLITQAASAVGNEETVQGISPKTKQNLLFLLLPCQSPYLLEFCSAERSCTMRALCVFKAIWHWSLLQPLGASSLSSSLFFGSSSCLLLTAATVLN